ncbi:hypothetical protein C8D92_101177 [Tamilnaduibacter salinus]|uniref:Glycine cleavage system protein T n=1 Tax=Tamilnaduibacter salinus TaxID=1484056 RepID=A0A2A2I7V1_9GAMM|nr:folate-binding protein YgfZ [Tamilnaduibacter salinus]PAV27195.1 glycine cleavage system protein T [Tamilnaduibacter salinus]PVY78971.1 hypothetical protein C8D92_101177 [Tamilnaduibacter salinus]
MSDSRARTERPRQAWAELPDQRLYRVSGKDPYRFLHGQLTQSMDEITPGQSRRGAVCTPKGRAYGLMMLSEYEGDYLLTMPAAVAEEATTQLSKFLMLFRGTDMAAPDEARVFGLWGEETALAVSDQARTLTSAGDAVTLPGGKLLRVEDADGTPRYEFWSPEGHAPFEGAATATPADWAAAEIAAGVAHLTPGSVSQYVPQVLNWQHLEGIHFRKGCYTGQEVIARMHYLGQQKKSVFRLASSTAAQPPATGTAIKAGNKPVGEVVNSVGFDDDTIEVLAVIKHSALQQPDNWTLGDTDTVLARRPMAYTVPEHDPKAA